MFSYIYKDLDFAHKYDEKPSASPDYEKHYHDYYEIYFFISGNVYYTVEEEKKKLQHGNILFIQPGEHHFVTLIDDTTPYERYVLKFHNNLVPEFLKEFLIKRSAFYTSTENLKPLFEKLDALYSTYNTMELQLLFSSVVTELLIKLYHSDYHEKALNTDSVITSVVQYINENLRLPLTPQHLCEKFYFSLSYLYKEFRAYMKIPIMKYIRSKKIIAANQLISRGEKSTKAAESFGFTDYSTFYRTFVSVMNFPPSKRRKK